MAASSGYMQACLTVKVQTVVGIKSQGSSPTGVCYIMSLAGHFEFHAEALCVLPVAVDDYTHAQGNAA